MKRGLAIIIAVIVALILMGGGLWVYVLFFGGQAPAGIGNPFGDGGEMTETFVPLEELPTNTGVEPALARKLRQLSSRAVAGAIAFERSGSTYVRFVELGTGHIYEIPAEGGEEVRLSNTTYVRTTGAEWSLSGTRVALTYEPDQKKMIVGSLEKTDEGDSVLKEEYVLPARSHSVAFSDVGDTLSYAVSGAAGTIGYTYGLKTGKQAIAFDVPLSKISIDWNPEPLIVVRPAATPGAAYTHTLERVAGGSAGFVAEREAGAVIATAGAISRAITADGTRTLEHVAIPEKCSGTLGSHIVCASPRRVDAADFPMRWYRGEISYDDVFFDLDVETGSTTLLVDPTIEAGKSLDAVHVRSSADGEAIVFMHRPDSTLWILTP